MYFFKTWIKQEWLLLTFSLLFLGLIFCFPQPIKLLPNYVDWRTIAALSGFLLITTGLKTSGYFDSLAYRILQRFSQERSLTLALIFTTAFFASLLTNDIALFIIVPVTLSIQDILTNDLSKIIIFEAIAANVGSVLTPFGNPQNLFIWHHWDIDFWVFLYNMLPLTLILLLLLTIMVIICFKPHLLHPHPNRVSSKHLSLLIISLISLFSFIVALELNLHYYAFITIFLVYLTFFPTIVKQSDWKFVLLFMLMFVDLNLVATLPWIKSFFALLRVNRPLHLYLSSILLSQIISNVPTAVLCSSFTHNWLVLAYGVNVGGNGTLIASLANLIALRLCQRKGMVKRFHKYSFLFLVISGFICWLLLRIGNYNVLPYPCFS